MPQWKQEQLQQLTQEGNQQQMFASALSLARQLGMEYLGYRLSGRLLTQGPQLYTFNNFPADWNEHYQQQDYQRIDPTVLHCHTSTMPVLWTRELFKNAPQIRKAAQSHGLCHGWSQGTQDLRGNQSILCVARAQGEVSLAELYEKSAQTLWLCNVLHTLMVNTLHPHKLSAVTLSAREQEVLRWTAAGKTAEDISCILTLSKSTVNFHIRSFINKLNTSNKTSAVAVAAMHGLL
ncbi:LuxR family transcriptional regulator [Pseudomonas aegrilactucae]|uniref:LuxR family transcriptional regulator n=1 Tax=Pseudomonas aegrilactucae TaxID=2854028 RepID=A0A9Q2XKW3_9PSED|nr:LuxR family transcriptional regulator [Pseudomonas aegrilactucae]MBV6288014.1 LuxR family transcriptional regulator [Pseudomonas aegrilactucae]